MPQYEEWIDIFPSRIPKRQYFLQLHTGEEHGLVIQLISEDYNVELEFGLVQGFSVFEEGVLLNPYLDYSDSNEFLQLRAQQFPSTIYQVVNGAYARIILQYMGNTLFSAFNLRQYNIVTENFVIMIVSHVEPIIQVRGITD